MEGEELRAVRERLARKLKRPDVPEQIWQYVLDDELPQAVANAVDAVEDGETFKDLVRGTRRLLKLYAGGPERRVPPGRQRSPVAVAQLSDYESERAAAASTCLAKLAAMRPEVRRFRRAVLRDERLTPEQARRFLRSPAVAVLSRAQFEEHGIPPLSHTATLVPLEGPSPIALLPWSVRTLGPGIVGALDEEHQAHHLVTLLLDPPGTTITAVSRVETMAGPGGVSGLQWFANLVERAKALAAGGGEGRCDQVPVFPGSLLDDLRRLGLDLEERYHWQQRDGAWFVLTGETPLASPFTAQAVFRDSDHAYGAITLTIEPWISADTVLKAYRVYQRRLLGRDNCPRSRRNLAVLQFVTQRSADDGARPGWDTLVEAWNAAHPQWIYRDPHGLADRRRFARDFGRAYRGVVVPSYDRSW